MKKYFYALFLAVLSVATISGQKVEYVVETIFPVTSTTAYTSVQVKNGLTVSPGIAADVTIQRASNGKKTDDNLYTGKRNLIRLVSPGNPTAGTKIPTQRFASIQVNGDCNITVYGMAGQAGQLSTLVISDGTNVLGTLATDVSHDTLYGKKVTYRGGAGTVYFYVENGTYTNFYIGIIVVDAAEPVANYYTVDDFESKTIGEKYPLKAWYETDGTATVTANPTNSSNKAIRIVTSNWDAMLKLNVNLPTGKTLANYDELSFDVYIPANSGDANPNYKKMHVFLDDVKKYEDTDFVKQADLSTWTRKTFSFSTLNLTGEDKAKSSFSFAFGMSTNIGDYYIDNVRLREVAGPVVDLVVNVENFESKTIGEAMPIKAHYPQDATALVAADPANPGNKAVNIISSNWDAMLKLNVTLPSGISLNQLESMSFDIYIPTNANDQNANYKKMFVFIDDVKKHEDADYPKQADIATWTTKTFLFDNFSLTNTEKEKTTFTLAFGISTDKGNYYIDNVKLKKKAVTTLEKPTSVTRDVYFANKKLIVKNDNSAGFQVYDLNGRLCVAAENVTVLDLSHLPMSIYLVRINLNGYTEMIKVII